MTDTRAELSAVLATDRLETADEMIEHLRLRTGEVRLELVLVGIEGRVPGEPAREGFAGVRTLATPAASIPAARAAGVRAADAPLVVLVETHCFPEPGWARALVDRWREGWLAIGPTIGNDNPSARGWASLILDYGPFVQAEPGPRREIPGHNSAYDRQLLLDMGGQLEAALENETLLHWRLAATAQQPYLDDGARVRHLNVTRAGAAARQWFHNARLFAARRAAGWAPSRRVLYAAGSPLLTVLFTSTALRHAGRVGHLFDVIRASPLVAASVTARAAGEMAGYLTLRADVAAVNPYELHRARYAHRSAGAGLSDSLVVA